MEIRASEYASRAALDEFVGKLSDDERKATAIAGTTAELARLNLSSRTKVYGVPCVAEDQEARPVFERPSRGIEQPSGLNGALKKRNRN